VSASSAAIEARLAQGLARLGLAATAAQSSQLLQFIALLQKWNSAYNLTALEDPDDMVVRHILDSLSCRPLLHGESVLDVGTGAGLPGFPLAVLDGARRFTLLDSSGKKMRFLRQALMDIPLDNVELVQSRVEGYRPADLFPTVVCRALSTLTEFARTCGRLVAPGGRLVALKGRYPHAELQDLPPPWQARQVAPVAVPFLDAERHIVMLERAS
jgi:16S rRNA (guanine527-N7)-methyltransferase